MNVLTRSNDLVVDTSRSEYAKLRPVPITAVTLEDDYWAPRIRTNRSVVLPSQYEHCEQTGRLDNFRRASGKKDLPFQGIYFNDSDVYKWIEAASWALTAGPDAKLQKMVDDAIAEIADAQQPNGYLNTYFMFEKEPERWTNLRNMHELYCAGHLFQGAVAHYRATGSNSLLNVARKFADHICSAFGPESEGKRPGAPGHEEIEMGFVELYRATGDQKYLAQAQYFVDARGNGYAGGDEYHQDHKPFRDMETMVGHAVRAVYLNAGAADVFAETGEEALHSALLKMWANMIKRRIYVSGGIGSRYEGEAFGKDYELPNERAYTETCAAIGSVMWSWRMLSTEAEARYADLIEHTLYNAVMPGLSLDGSAYFYQNPLEDDGTHRRQPWFGCACCPPNVARLLASLPSYFYSTSSSGVWVHLYATGSVNAVLPNGREVSLSQRTSYPWGGDIEVEVRSNGNFDVFLRIPMWCESGVSLRVAGDALDIPLVPGSYARINRDWKAGDVIKLTLPMPVRLLEAHPYVLEDTSRVAIARGPILYCIEQADNPQMDPRNVVIPENTKFETEHDPELLGGVTTVKYDAQEREIDAGWEGKLYRSIRSGQQSNGESTLRLTAIPYYAWANRQPGRMQVWMRRGKE